MSRAKTNTKKTRKNSLTRKQLLKNLTLSQPKNIALPTADTLEEIKAYPLLTKKMSIIINELKKHDTYLIFFKPIPAHLEKKYNEEIKHPIHFNDILNKINKMQYTTFGGILSDIDLLWNNCWTFNGLPDYISDSKLFGFSNFAAKIQWKLEQYIELFKNELIHKKYLSLNCEKIKTNKNKNSQIIHWNILSKPLCIDTVNTFDKVIAFPSLTCNVKKIINKIKLQDGKRDFFQDPVKLIGVEYMRWIEKPIHFGQILERIENRQYKTMGEIKDDIELLFSNCYTYNGKNEFAAWAAGLELCLKGYMNEFIDLLIENGYIKRNVSGKKRDRDLCKLIEPKLKKQKIV